MYDQQITETLDRFPRLTTQQARVLSILLCAANRYVTKSHIQEELFQMTSDRVSDLAIRDHIRRIRPIIEGSGIEVETKYGLGYRALTKREASAGIITGLVGSAAIAA